MKRIIIALSILLAAYTFFYFSQTHASSGSLDAIAQPTLAAQEASSRPNDDLPRLHTVLKKGLDENNYLAPLMELQEREAQYLSSEQMRGNYLDYMTLLNSYVSNFEAAYSYEEKFLSDIEPRSRIRERNARELSSSPVDNYRTRDAFEVINAAADTHQVIMINEEHRTPVHRAFTLRLLATLYAKGFRYFAAETLYSADAELNRRGYPTQKTGFYTSDPVYGDMIRTALRLGFKVIPYEYEGTCTPQPNNPQSCDEERERSQAQNLVDRILRNDPKAKVLVHVGRGHNSKTKYEGEFAFMAWHFREISGINPFSIDQLQYSERRNPLDEDPLYRYVTRKGLIHEPTVFQSTEGRFWVRNPGYDLQVFHPRARYEMGRATWLQMGGLRRPSTINLRRLNLAARHQQFSGREPVLVQAFFAGESADAVPVDQIVLYPAREVPVLMLPKGALRIRAINRLGRLIGQYSSAAR
ncbi:MAG: hypothetical protein AUG51_01780 [Acidobacteria bacterium 13_1_20CM_3_53_8]|nr:MAG: hypothetical protein AUG51_01780 [Acidobacteria bacterium 13_1_20CM_3_53_8]